MCGKRSCIARSTRSITVPSPTPASNMRTAGVGDGTVMLRVLERDAIGDDPLFAAGVDEQEILLPVVEEAEVALWIVVAGRHQGVGRCRDSEGRGQGYG